MIIYCHNKEVTKLSYMIIYCVISLKPDLKLNYVLLPASEEILQLLNVMDNLYNTWMDNDTGMY